MEAGWRFFAAGAGAKDSFRRGVRGWLAAVCVRRWGAFRRGRQGKGGKSRAAPTCQKSSERGMPSTEPGVVSLCQTPREPPCRVPCPTVIEPRQRRVPPLDRSPPASHPSVRFPCDYRVSTPPSLASCITSGTCTHALELTNRPVTLVTLPHGLIYVRPILPLQRRVGGVLVEGAIRGWQDP